MNEKSSTTTSLDNLNVLSPDLPEPSYSVTECEEEHLVWEVTSQFRVEVYPDSKDVYICSDYDITEPLSLTEVRAMLRTLDAAEAYMEKK